MEMTDLTAVITGASGQLGRAIALALAARGMDCVCHYHRNKASAEAVAKQIEAIGRKAAWVQADLAHESQIERLFDVAAGIGRVRVLINSAAIFERRRLTELTAGDIDQTLRVNLAAPILTSRAFVRVLKADGLDCAAAEGPVAKIINVADVAAIKPWAEYAAYCAAKAGLIGLTKALAKELAPGVTVNAVAPGMVAGDESMSPDRERKQLLKIPLGRFGRPEEITKSIEFLLDNDYITGLLLAVDGGRSI